jgi:hypothetical protein
MNSNVVILPERIWAKVEGFGADRTGGAVKPKPEGFGPNAPGPSGFRAAGDRFVEPLDRWNPIALRVSPAESPPRPRNRMTTFEFISL